MELIVARLAPQPDVAATVRKLPATRAAATLIPARGETSGRKKEGKEERMEPATPCAAAADSTTSRFQDADRTAPSPAHRPVIAPLTLERYRVQLTVGRETHDKLRRAQDLLRHAVPSGDPAVIFDRALTLLVEQLERTKCAAAVRPRASQEVGAGSRRIPAAVRRVVWNRDGGCCAFMGSRGRCAERAFLELHHVVPFAVGGAPDASNIQLRCRAHNQFEADLFFGADVVRERTAAWG
ncbi:MAG: HNH endonuclease [Acidobacteriota bacterium]|nr:HNH endonuclease [Acidobacteriota bacterium]